MGGREWVRSTAKPLKAKPLNGNSQVNSQVIEFGIDVGCFQHASPALR